MLDWIERCTETSVRMHVDSNVYDKIFRTCCNAPQSVDPEPARVWLKQSIEQGLQLHPTKFNHAIAAFSRRLDVERSESCFEIATEGGLQPNETTFTLLVNANIAANNDEKVRHSCATRTSCVACSSR